MKYKKIVVSSIGIFFLFLAVMWLGEKHTNRRFTEEMMKVVQKMDNRRFIEEIGKVLKSDEKKGFFKRILRDLDSNAFTPKGFIKSYKIDYGSIKHDFMGDNNVTLCVNNDKKMVIKFYFDEKNSSIRNGVISYCSGGD